MSRGKYLSGLASKWWLILTVAYALVGAYDLTAGQVWDDLPRLADIASLDMPWYFYLFGLLGILLLATFEGGYRQYRAVEKKLVALKENGLQQLIRVTPSQGSGMRPTGQGNTVSEIDAYLDVETIDQDMPLHNCRIKLLELEHYLALTDRGTQEVRESWVRDNFYQGQTYFFSWSGRADTVDAVDVPRSERACIAKCIDTRPELTTTAGAVGHLFHGDKYHLTVEVTADNSLPLVKEYLLQMYQGSRSVIEEWDDSRTTWL